MYHFPWFTTLSSSFSSPTTSITSLSSSLHDVIKLFTSTLMSFFNNNKQIGLLSLLGSMEDVKPLHEKIVDHEQHAMKEKTTHHREH